MGALRSGLEVSPSNLIRKGTIVFMRGQEVLGISTKGRRDFLQLFGFAPETPRGCTGLKLSIEDYAEIAALPQNAGEG